MFYQQNQKFGFRKSKVYRTLCGALLGTFLVLAAQTTSADETTDSTGQTHPQVEAVTQPTTVETTVETTAEAPVVVNEKPTGTANETPAVVNETPTVTTPATTEARVSTPGENTNVTANVTTTDSTGSQYVSEKAKETAEKAFSNVNASKALTSEDIKAPDNLTDSQNEVLDSVKESLDALPANVRSVAKSVTVVNENNGNSDYVSSANGEITINAHYFDTDTVGESTKALYHEIGRIIDDSTYDSASGYSLSRDETVQPLLKTAYPGQPNYEAFASLFGTYMLQETGQKAISTAVDMEIKKYFDTVLNGFTVPKSDSITKPLLDTVDSLRAKGKTIVFDGMIHVDSVQEASDLNNKTIARLTNTRRTRAITPSVTHFTAATAAPVNNVTVTMSSNATNTTTDNINTFNTARIHTLTVNVSGTGAVGDNSYIDVTVDTNVPITNDNAVPFVDDFQATGATGSAYGKNTQHAKLTLTGIAAGIQKDFTIQTNSLNTRAPITSTTKRTTTYKLVINGNVVDTRVITETFTPAKPTITINGTEQRYTVIKDTDTAFVSDLYTSGRVTFLTLSKSRAYGIVDIQVPKNVIVSNARVKSLESYKVIEGEIAHYLIPQDKMPDYIETNTKVDAKSEYSANPSATRLEQVGKMVYYYSDSPFTTTLDGLKNVNHVDKDFTILTHIDTQIQQNGTLEMTANLFNYDINVLLTPRQNSYTVHISNGGQSDIRKEVPFYGVEIDFNRDDKNIYQGEYYISNTNGSKLPYNIYNAATNELIGTIGETQLNIPKSVSRIRVEPKEPLTVGYGPNATVKNIAFAIMFSGTNDTAKAWKKNMDANQISEEITRFDAKLLNRDSSVAAQTNTTLYITNEFIGTRLIDDSYAFFAPTAISKDVTLPLLVTKSLRGNLPNVAIDKIEIKDKYGIIGRNFNSNFKASDEYQPISLNIDNTGRNVNEAHRANIGNFVDTVYNGGPYNNTYIGLKAKLPAGTHIYDIPVRITTTEGVSVVNKDGSTSTSNVTEAVLHIVTYDSKTTGTNSYISSGENSGTNITIPNVNNGLVATTYVNNFTDSSVNQLTAMSYIPKAGIEGSTANTSLKSAVTAPSGWKVIYTTDAISGNYKTDRNLSFTDSVTDYSKVTALKFVSTGPVKATTATPFDVPLNFEGTASNGTVNYRSVLLTDDNELLSTPVTAKPKTGNIIYEYVNRNTNAVIKTSDTGALFTGRTENHTFEKIVTDKNGFTFKYVSNDSPNEVSTVVNEGTTKITRYYVSEHPSTVEIRMRPDLTDETTKEAFTGKAGIPGFTHEIFSHKPDTTQTIEAGEDHRFNANSFREFSDTPDRNYAGRDVMFDYSRVDVTASDDLKPQLDKLVADNALVDFNHPNAVAHYTITGTSGENSHAVITYYYKIRSGSITQHFVDEEGNKIADDTATGKLVADAAVVNVAYPSVITKDGVTYNYVRNTQSGTLTSSDHSPLTQIGTGTNSSNVLSPTGDVDITYVYKKATKDVIIRYLVDRTDKITNDFMTHKIHAPELVDTDVQSNGILKPETRQTINKNDTVTVTDPSDKVITKGLNMSQTGRSVTFTYARKVVTQDGDNTIISYYYTVDRGRIIQKFVDEGGNKLLDNTTTESYVSESAYIDTNHPTRITKNGIVYGLVKTENPLPTVDAILSNETINNDFGTNPSESLTVLVPNGDATITYTYKELKGTIIQHFVDTNGKKIIGDAIYLDKPVDEVVTLDHPKYIEDGVDTYVFVRQNKADPTKITEGTTEVTYVYEKAVHEIPGDAPKVDIPELEATRYVSDKGEELKDTEEGTKDAPKVLKDKWQYDHTGPKKDGITTHVYVEIQHEIPNDAPQVDIPEAKATVYVDENGNNVKTPGEGLHDSPKVIDDKWQYVRTIPEKDGILTHVYTKITYEIPNEAPKVDIPEAKATVYVDENGNNVKTPDEGLHDGPKVIDDKWEYVRTIPEKDGILTHVYTKIAHEIPNNPPIVDIPEAKATHYVNADGVDIKTPDGGLHDGPKVIEDKWEYVRTIPEKDGILTHVYTTITHEIPNNPPVAEIPEAKVTVYINEQGNAVKTPDEGLHDGPKVIDDRWEYVKTISEKDGILTHVYTTITHEIPNNPPVVDIPEAKVTVYVGESGNNVKTPDNGLHEGPKVIEDKWQYIKTIPEKDGILTHVYTTITHEIPNNPPVVEIPELEITRYVDEHGNDIKNPEPGNNEAPKTIGKYEFSRTIPKKDGVTAHVYKEIPKETPNKPMPNTGKRIPNKPVDKTPKVEQPVNEATATTQKTVTNTTQNVPAKTNELPHTGDNDSSKALAVSGLAMFMTGIVGVFRKKKQ